jgi:hypothetical protein
MGRKTEKSDFVSWLKKEKFSFPKPPNRLYSPLRCIS